MFVYIRSQTAESITTSYPGSFFGRAEIILACEVESIIVKFAAFKLKTSSLHIFFLISKESLYIQF
jgi:hypothetical protein